MKTLLIVGLAGVALAQSPLGSPPSAAPTGAAGATAASDDVVRALDLPVAAQRARRAGVSDSDLKQALDGMRAARHSAGDAAIVVDEAATDVEAHGPVDNFGAFVQSQLDAGLRGKDLAAAIRAEHEKRGKKHGEGGDDEDDDDDKGGKRPEKLGAPGAGKPLDRGAGGASGGATRGQSGERGKKDDDHGRGGATRGGADRGEKK